MSILNIDLEKSLQTGFINKSIPSQMEYLPQLLVNDKKQGKKVLGTIIQELNFCDEFWFSVAFITTNGVATLIETLINLEKRGIKGKILVSQYLNFTQPEALKKLLKFENIEVKIAVDSSFHSKGYLFKKGEIYNLIIGSSNLTAQALCTNVEWNLKISATPVSHIIFNAIREFTSEYEKAVYVDLMFIANYELFYNKQLDFSKLLKNKLVFSNQIEIIPNSMQVEALESIDNLRRLGKKKALLISATGTGKTFLSAFDVKRVNPRKFLFVVHRLNIAKASMKAFKTIFGQSRSMGLYSGNVKDLDADFVFSTIQTLYKDEHLIKFNPEHFEYVVIDETHRAGAESYQSVLDYFKPKFLLGMTATPERTDGLDVFKLFDYNIAYEIRLHRALDEEMLSPFHYYGITDITVNGEVLDDNADFNLLTSSERIDRILEKASIYGCDNGKVRGLVFCSSLEESSSLSKGFNQRGYKTVALSGSNSEEDRAQAIIQLESEESENQLDYIFTVDIFNEGIDIPSVNQIIMLRPTQSAIVFVQQLGRGLRKIEEKEYLTVIDVIGNYANNYLVPIALYGDTSYNKDSLRKLMSSGSNLIPGTSTINFDKITHKRIFEAIDSANMQRKRDLVDDYNLLKFRLGRIPMMVDFINHGSRDPQLFSNYSRSYFNFVSEQEADLKLFLSKEEKKLLELFSNEINNTKRVEECLILNSLIHFGKCNIDDIKKKIESEYGYIVSDATLDSCVDNLNFKFITEKRGGQLVSVHELHGISLILRKGQQLYFEEHFSDKLDNKTFRQFLEDNIEYSISVFNSLFDKDKYIDGFVLYRKYSRKDVFRILNWERNPVAQNVGGYIISSDKSNCPIFVNYHKEESISNTIKYEDGFLNNTVFQWMSKSKRTLNSPDVQTILNYRNGLRIPLFIKKHNDEGTDFYYMGEVTPIENSFGESSIPDDKGGRVSVVKVDFLLNRPVEDMLYSYLTNKTDNDVGVISQIENAKETIYPFKILSIKDAMPYVNCIPLFNIKASAGSFSDLQINSETQWIELDKSFKYSKDHFVCQVVGESMNEVIPNNSWCLFRTDSGGTRNGNIVLVKQANIQDPDFAAGFTVKYYESTKVEKEGSWQHESITLKPKSFNSGFKNIILTEEDLMDFKVEGIFIRVLN